MLKLEPRARSALLVLDFGQAAVGPVAACYPGMLVLAREAEVHLPLATSAALPGAGAYA